MLTDHPHPPFRHYCRICKKGFGCGRALGGHMRAHGIIDDAFDDKAPGHKRAYYSLRTNPNRFKSCRVCENCGKEFLSWKSFLQHGRCTSDGGGDSSPDSGGGGAAAWFKGKRSRRAKPAAAASSEEEDLANCLVMLSAAKVDPILIVEAEAEDSCASASKEEVDPRQIFFDPASENAKTPDAVVPRGMFECKACKKVFSSHQALGGHRASHKKVKGCFAAKADVELDELPPPITLDDDMIVHGDMSMSMSMSMAIVPFDNHSLAIARIKKKSKVHECSICHRIFASGQALGGHKRCHWITSNSPDPAAAMPPQKLLLHHHHHQQLSLRPMAFDPSEPCLDLNLPLPGDDLRRDMGSPLRLDVPAGMYLQTWAKKDKGNKNDWATCSVNVEDEADSKVKLAKLSDLKDMGGESSAPWLQVGIGSSGNEGGDP